MTIVKYITFLCLAAFLSTGCNKDTSSAPVPMPVEEMPAAFKRAFEHADKAIQDQANRYLAAVQKKDAVEAFNEIRDLSMNPALTEDQRSMLGRARMTTAQQLQSAAAAGDAKSTDTLQIYRSAR